MSAFTNFNAKELQTLKRLNTPKKIQDFLDGLPINIEKHRETCMSPRQVLNRRTAHCAEGAMLAAVALWYHGQKPLLLDLRAVKSDQDHVVALFKNRGRWGAISKTNHAVLRYREPIYKNVRELALSYFHEYFTNAGRKTLRSYSEPFDLSKIKNRDWLTAEHDLWDVIYALDQSRHHNILNANQIKQLRRADKIEIKAGKLTEW